MTPTPLVPDTARGVCATAHAPTKENDLTASYWFELRPRVLTVVELAKLSSTLVRVRFVADDNFEGFPAAAPEDHVKLFFDTDDAGQPVLPSLVNGRWSPRGLTFRDYTVRWFDAEARVLDIDFVLHDHGVAGRWAGRAAVGDSIGALGPRGAFLVKDVFPWYVFAVDETALPALARWVEGLRPDVPATAYITVEDEHSHIDLPSNANLNVVWLHRSGPHATTTGISDAIVQHRYPDRSGFVWVAGEALSIKAARRFVKAAGFPRDHWDVDGYWRQGIVNLDHHQDDDDDTPESPAGEPAPSSESAPSSEPVLANGGETPLPDDHTDNERSSST